MREIVQAAPRRPYIENINNHILTGEMYKALKQARKLIAYEQESRKCETRRRIPVGSEGDRKSA
jgi:flagellar protein FlbT